MPHLVLGSTWTSQTMHIPQAPWGAGWGSFSGLVQARQCLTQRRSKITREIADQKLFGTEALVAQIQQLPLPSPGVSCPRPPLLAPCSWHKTPASAGARSHIGHGQLCTGPWPCLPSQQENTGNTECLGWQCSPSLGACRKRMSLEPTVVAMSLRSSGVTQCCLPLVGNSPSGLTCLANLPVVLHTNYILKKCPLNTSSE